MASTAAFALTFAGCGGGIKIADGPFAGPPIEAEEQVVVIEAPSPGWAVELDQTRPGPDGDEVFLTLRRPDPQFLYPQMIVTQRVATGARPGQAIVVFARTLEAHENARSQQYSRVAPD